MGTMKLIPLRMPPALWARIMKRAKKEDISAAELVRRTMRKELS